MNRGESRDAKLEGMKINDRERTGTAVDAKMRDLQEIRENEQGRIKGR